MSSQKWLCVSARRGGGLVASGRAYQLRVPSSSPGVVCSEVCPKLCMLSSNVCKQRFVNKLN